MVWENVACPDTSYGKDNSIFFSLFCILISALSLVRTLKLHYLIQLYLVLECSASAYVAAETVIAKVKRPCFFLRRMKNIFNWKIWDIRCFELWINECLK